MPFTVKEILKMEVAPALGCTEPVAIALAAAAASSLLPQRGFDRLELWVDPNIYKNGIAVSIPGTGGLSGLDMAAALGALGGDPALSMEVLEPINDEAVSLAKEALAEGKVKVNLRAETGLYIKVVITSGEDQAEALISELHDNLVYLAFNGEEIKDHPLLGDKEGGSANQLSEMESWFKELPLSKLLEMIDDFDQEDMDFLEQSVKVNLKLAEYGLKHGSGLGIGRALERLVRQGLIKKDMILSAKMLASAAADARMAGVKLPAMASAGSGNHGLTAVLPIWALRDYLEVDDQEVLKAIGLSHLVTGYVKAHTGRLSAVCGCSIAAGAGAAAGVTYLLGGSLHYIAGAIVNLTSDLAGVICDGAKASCALKLSTAAGTAVQAALFALQGVSVQPTDGIVGGTLEQTTKNVGILSTEGMVETDRTILKIMLEKHFAEY
ncbi:MAG: L-serine ammonia-lyase, iron-sulfur-dependent, subunit alpha [Deltaproteobacteria bacterium]|nr:L-serine ammonia-lyase, iron-sulfur-dependent, subunit alpha [Deltaproteobacteria bacterium]